MRAELPLITGLTPYVRFGDVVGPLCALLTALAVAFALLRRRRPEQRVGVELAPREPEGLV